MRAQIHQLIKDELRVNPKPYVEKNADELSAAFKQMLIERLTRTNETKATQPPKNATVTHSKPINISAKASKWRLRPVEIEPEPETGEEEDDWVEEDANDDDQ